MPKHVSELEDTLFDSTCKSLAEASIHASVLSQREKDGKEGISSFNLPMVRFHTMYLFEIQDKIKALSTHVQLCYPQLASHFGFISVRTDTLCQLLDSLT